VIAMTEITIEDPSQLTAHPAAALFPMMSDSELEELTADIRAHGLRMPIVVMGLEILDGRNRLEGCKRAEVAPRFVEWDGTGSPSAWIFSVNLHRRHLTTSQRAMLAARAIDVFKKEAIERQDAGVQSADAGRSRDKAADLLNVSAFSVLKAQQVIAKATPELVAAVDAGQVPVATATQVISLPPEEQRAIVREKKVSERAREERDKRRARKPVTGDARPPPSVVPTAAPSSPDNDNDSDENDGDNNKGDNEDQDGGEDEVEDDEESTLDPRNRPEPQPINVTAFKGEYRKGNKPKDEAAKVDQILAAARSALYTWRWIAIEWSEDKRWDMKFALRESGPIAHHLQQAVAKLEEISAICNGKKPAPPSEQP
jgi:ParB-like chromosome segregation protein Spo0J